MDLSPVIAELSSEDGWADAGYEDGGLEFDSGLTVGLLGECLLASRRAHRGECDGRISVESAVRNQV